MKFKKFKYYCTEGCGFVDKNHRCEQWGSVFYIPVDAIEAINGNKQHDNTDEQKELTCNNCKHLNSGYMEMPCGRCIRRIDLKDYYISED